MFVPYLLIILDVVLTSVDIEKHDHFADKDKVVAQLLSQKQIVKQVGNEE
jgi:hypothetical protein